MLNARMALRKMLCFQNTHHIQLLQVHQRMKRPGHTIQCVNQRIRVYRANIPMSNIKFLLFIDNHQAPYPSYPPSYEMPPTPRYEDYQYASPLAADQQYTQQHYDYHNQSYHATPAYANQQQSTNVVIKSDGPSAIPVRTERSPLKRKAGE